VNKTVHFGIHRAHRGIAFELRTACGQRGLGKEVTHLWPDVTCGNCLVVHQREQAEAAKAQARMATR
jgi:hypothetical protein